MDYGSRLLSKTNWIIARVKEEIRLGFTDDECSIELTRVREARACIEPMR